MELMTDPRVPHKVGTRSTRCRHTQGRHDVGTSHQYAGAMSAPCRHNADARLLNTLPSLMECCAEVPIGFKMDADWSDDSYPLRLRPLCIYLEAYWNLSGAFQQTSGQCFQVLTEKCGLLVGSTNMKIGLLWVAMALFGLKTNTNESNSPPDQLFGQCHSPGPAAIVQSQPSTSGQQ